MSVVSLETQPVPAALAGMIEHFSATAVYMPGFVYQLMKDPQGNFRYTYASEHAEELFQTSVSDVLADANILLDMIHPEDLDWVMAESEQCAKSMQHWNAEFRMILPDGKTIWVECYDTPMRLDDGSMVWTGYANEITQRKAFETAYRQSEAKFRAFVENANDIIYNLSREGILTYVSPNWTEMLGHPTEDVIGKSFEHFVHPDDIAHCHAFLLMVFGTGKKQSGIEYQVRHKNGDWYWYRSNASPLFDDNGEVCSYIGIARDISEHKQLLDRMQHMAHHDALTGLANRSLFFDHLHQAILQAQRDKQGLAVLFLDLDKFKPINDDYGHAIGDLLLQQVAMRIKTCVRTSDVVGRIGGDEFVVLLSNVTLPDTAELVANKIRESLAVPFQLREIPAQISVSVGMAFYPEHGKQALELVRSADEAMYLAKAGNGVSQPAMQKNSGQ